MAARAADRRRFILGGSAAALCGAASPAWALDCEFERCLDAARLPGAVVPWRRIISRGQRLFGISTKVYIVSFAQVSARVPYLQRANTEFAVPEEVHIPEIYHATIEAQHAGREHYIWHYIIGHEFAHSYQDRIGLIDAFTFPKNANTSFELHADFLAGFFIAREFGLALDAIDQIFDEVRLLPNGERGTSQYYGEPTQRYYMATQGALLALRHPTPSLAEASAEGIRRLEDVDAFGQ